MNAKNESLISEMRKVAKPAIMLVCLMATLAIPALKFVVIDSPNSIVAENPVR